MTTFRSVKEAVAYALSHRRGPQMARPSAGRVARGTWRSPWDAPEIRACMTRAGIPAGSETEREIESWARGRGPKPIAAERALRVEMDAAGLLERELDIVRRTSVRNTWQDPDTGEEMSSTGSQLTTAELEAKGLG